MQKENRDQSTVVFYLKVQIYKNKQVSIAEVKVVGFLTEHNLPFATADHLGPLFKSIFGDSKLASLIIVVKPKHLVF